MALRCAACLPTHLYTGSLVPGIHYSSPGNVLHVLGNFNRWTSCVNDISASIDSAGGFSGGRADVIGVLGMLIVGAVMNVGLCLFDVSCGNEEIEYVY